MVVLRTYVCIFGLCFLVCVCGVRMNVETKVNTSSVFFPLLPSLAPRAHSASCASFQTNPPMICCVVFLSVFPGVRSPFNVCEFEKNKLKPKHFFGKLMHGIKSVCINYCKT